jgi:chromosome segregation ATPase
VSVSGCLRPLTKRMDRLSEQMDEVNGRLALVNEQLGEINHGLNQVEKGVDKLNEKIDVLNAKIGKTNEQLVVLKELDEHMGKVVVSADAINKKISTIADLINRLSVPAKK